MKKTIGIIGGMGPEGTADLYMKIIRYYQQKFNAKYDKDFPEFFISSIPIPDVVESLENEKITLTMLTETAIKLQNAQCDFIVIACNTVQYLLNDIKKSITVPIIDIAKVIALYLNKKRYKKVSILATSATLEKKVYDNEIDNVGIEVIKPNNKDQKIVTKVIMTQLAGKTTKEETNMLIQVINNLKNQGAEAVLIACTDLPMVINQKDTKIKLIECTQIYANQAAFISFSSKQVNSFV
ncbi:hypothetical protein COY87_03305 [Candidatus Roizmanbacteria bacterium CG_4_10_14_0_8_um_filter_33_9]|uniref:Aspartate racemase n=1 Tax=Candidatus Roizmanbacteria bacterium CG_4_10_14_0_8_um_filter_33_9 TaxID=1974826 RepID=A0A2M7QI37_9BACT|nr:MAG: hypothetical protein COY87_03305 [Candidatus Roizmanbacteria bacterium CG_4_10_14_0_8_um_filter_33_9]